MTAVQTKAETIAVVLLVYVCTIGLAELTRDGLAPEGLALGDLEVVAQFQVVGEVESVSHSHVAKALEEVHLKQPLDKDVKYSRGGTCRQRITGLPCSSNKLSQHVELNLNTSSSENDTRRYGEDQSKSKTEEDGTNARVGRPTCDSCNTESNSSNLHPIS